MNDNAVKWVAALRSGDYKQGTSQLTKLVNGQAEHCCLGVACHLAAAEGVVASKVSNREVFYGNEVLYMPASVADWLGIDSAHRSRHTGIFRPIEDGALAKDYSLAAQNDDGATFEEIADLIEEHADFIFGAFSA